MFLIINKVTFLSKQKNNGLKPWMPIMCDSEWQSGDSAPNTQSLYHVAECRNSCHYGLDAFLHFLS